MYYEIKHPKITHSGCRVRRENPRAAVIYVASAHDDGFAGESKTFAANEHPRPTHGDGIYASIAVAKRAAATSMVPSTDAMHGALMRAHADARRQTETLFH
jgi:hypothetical protein